MQYVGIVIAACAEAGLGCKVVAFLKGINKYVNEGVYHKDTQKEKSRKQIQPGFPAAGERIIIFHIKPPG